MIRVSAEMDMALLVAVVAAPEVRPLIGVPPGIRVLVATKPVDFRKGADGLAAMAQEVLKQDTFSGAVLVFHAKRADTVKIVAWDGTGLVMLWKRPDQGVFRRPITDEVIHLSPAQLSA